MTDIMPFTPIVATLGYVLSEDGLKVLMVHRNRRPDDAHLGKYNGLGGKLLASENIIECLRREIREEAGIECTHLELRGTISWPGFGKHGEDWFGFIFLINQWTGQPLTENDEGSLQWIEITRIQELPLWEGDRHFLSLVFGDRSKQFHGVMPYRDGKPVGWRLTLL